MKQTAILTAFFLTILPAWGNISQLDTENADRNLTSIVTVLTDTPDVSNPVMCQGLVYFGDGSKDLDGTGGFFELTITVGGQTVQPGPQVINFGTAARSSVWTSQFPVPASAEVVLRAKSPNAADTDVDVTAYLYDVFPVNVASGAVEANLVSILGTAITETAGQIAAAFKKFFDIASPAKTVNDVGSAPPRTR